MVKSLITVFVLVLAMTSEGRAGLLFNLEETGGAVVVSGGGTLTLNGAGINVGAGPTATAQADANQMRISGGNGADIHFYSLVAAPTISGDLSFSAPLTSVTTTHQSVFIASNPSGAFLFTPSTYSSGENYSITGTLVGGTSFADFGITAGQSRTATFTQSGSSLVQSISFTASSGVSVPEPSTFSLMGFGFAVVARCGWRRRAQRRKRDRFKEEKLLRK